MKDLSPPDIFPEIYLALVHHPVKNKNGEIIASAVTNLDLHDISRTAKTFGVTAFYVVTPLIDQQKLVETIASHWTNGAGGEYNPLRREALILIRIKDSIEAVLSDIKAWRKETPAKKIQVIATCAQNQEKAIRFDQLRKDVKDPEKLHLILFGTAWGLSDEVFEQADHVLEPIAGTDDYNHLPVRSAVAIVLDRLSGT